MSGKNGKATRVTRRSLKTLQHAASDRENLVGRPSKILKKNLLENNTELVEVKKESSTKETQANLSKNVSVDDLTNPDGPSEKYWEILAEKRQVALHEALEENEKLSKIIEDLKEENAILKRMLDEANSFVEVIKEELANSSTNDTGIDVNDVSTSDETAEAENKSSSDEN